jgi:hypothetical protein
MFEYLDDLKRDLAMQYASKDIGKIDGWFGEQQIILFDYMHSMQYEAGVHVSIVEVGVHHGRCFGLLNILRRADECGLAIDVFEDQASNYDQSGSGSHDHFITI